MADKTSKTKAKRPSKGQRIHTRRMKQAARNPEVESKTSKQSDS